MTNIPGFGIPNAQTHYQDYLAWCKKNGTEPEYDEDGPIEKDSGCIAPGICDGGCELGM